MDLSRFTHLTFDCYGTLIDWETGILEALLPLLQRQGAQVTPEEALRLYVAAEAEEEAGPYQPYRSVLESVAGRVAAGAGISLLSGEAAAFAGSVGRWPPFPDTVSALRALHPRFKLCILSNIDDDLFAETNWLLGVTFDAVITAQQVRSYKPRKAHFETALERLQTPREQILHVAQSLYHDHNPAREMGFATVRIARPSRIAGDGLAPPADAQPDLELPDLRSLAALAEQC